MPHFSDVAITLRRLDFSETSQVLVLFARAAGKVRVIAKGVKRGTRKRYATGIDLLEMGHLIFTERQERQANLATLVEWKQITAFSGLRNDLKRLYGAQYVAETTAALTEDRDPHECLFDALAEALHALEAAPNMLPAVVEYQVRLLTEIGLYPELGRCLECGRAWKRRPGWFLSSHRGGLICRDCESVMVEKRRLRDGTVELLTGLTARKTPSSAQPPHWIGGFDVLDYHITHLMGRPPATSPYVVSESARRTLR
ncbi:MAG: DNA repair protein RecO [Phycisphaerales bacterium]|nr:MAG: DNA repair protein RecO [Phycisphaerales bacterium]